ncbi:MAG: hypothetical protein ACLSCV_05530 [Acutalibacteraceae bacterium]
MDHIDLILTALKRLGFDDILKSQSGRAGIGCYKENHFDGNMPKPIISSACPLL